MSYRLGKNERARVKNRRLHSRPEMWAHVGCAGTYHVKAGRNKFEKVHNWLHNQFELIEEPHIEGELLTLKSGTVTKRRLYTVTVADNFKEVQC